MKQTLTPEQSANLIARGVSAESASEWEEADFKDVPIFNVGDLLSLLPKEPKHDSIGRPFTLHIREYKGDWRVWYARDGADVMIGSGKHAPELIDALYNLLFWAIDHNHVKLD